MVHASGTSYCLQFPRLAGTALYATSRAQRGTFAPSTVIRTGFACTFRGDEYGENLCCSILFVTPSLSLCGVESEGS
jgi:hypothetical protein